MQPIKDQFSRQAKGYARYRPTYPPELYAWLMSLVPAKTRAWDCATGNGQVAEVLASYFDQVEATDISQAQLDKAPEIPHVRFRRMRGEQTDFPNAHFDLITVGQALHWFDLDGFFAEVRRVLKPQGVLGVWGYGLVRIHPEIDALLDQYYLEVVGPYWDPARKLVDSEYNTIRFPFPVISPPIPLIQSLSWTLEHFEGYLNTWSGLHRYLEVHPESPVPQLIQDIRAQKLWEKDRTVSFPIFTKVGRA